MNGRGTGPDKNGIRPSGSSNTRRPSPSASSKTKGIGGGKNPGEMGRDVPRSARRINENRAPTNANKKKKEQLPDRIKSFFTPRVTLYFAIGLVILLIAACMLINIIIGVRSIEIIGADMSEREELIAAAGIEEGSGYFSYNTRDAEKNILKSVPCVEEAEISRSVFGNVRITVTEKKAYWYTAVFGEYYALSEDLEVIRRSELKKTFSDRGLVRLDFPEVKSVILGRMIEFSDGDRDCTFVGEFLSEVRESELYKSGRIYHVGIETKFEIFTVCDLKYKINLGKYSGAKMKLDTAARALENELFSGEDRWHIDVSDVSNITSRRDETLDFSYLYPEC